MKNKKKVPIALHVKSTIISNSKALSFIILFYNSKKVVDFGLFIGYQSEQHDMLIAQVRKFEEFAWMQCLRFSKTTPSSLHTSATRFPLIWKMKSTSGTMKPRNRESTGLFNSLYAFFIFSYSFHHCFIIS